MRWPIPLILLTLLLLTASLSTCGVPRPSGRDRPRILAVYPDGRAILEGGVLTGPGYTRWEAFRPEPEEDPWGR